MELKEWDANRGRQGGKSYKNQKTKVTIFLKQGVHVFNDYVPLYFEE